MPKPVILVYVNCEAVNYSQNPNTSTDMPKILKLMENYVKERVGNGYYVIALPTTDQEIYFDVKFVFEKDYAEFKFQELKDHLTATMVGIQLTS